MKVTKLVSKQPINQPEKGVPAELEKNREKIRISEKRKNELLMDTALKFDDIGICIQFNPNYSEKIELNYKSEEEADFVAKEVLPDFGWNYSLERKGKTLVVTVGALAH
jgi:hypothetical protein